MVQGLQRMFATRSFWNWMLWKICSGSLLSPESSALRPASRLPGGPGHQGRDAISRTASSGDPAPGSPAWRVCDGWRGCRGWGRGDSAVSAAPETPASCHSGGAAKENGVSARERFSEDVVKGGRRMPAHPRLLKSSVLGGKTPFSGSLKGSANPTHRTPPCSLLWMKNNEEPTSAARRPSLLPHVNPLKT